MRSEKTNFLQHFNPKFCRILQSIPGEVEKAVGYAINAGYRHIDTARIYGNEGEIGNALEKAYKEGIVKREDMYITTKVSTLQKLRNKDTPTSHSIIKQKRCRCFCASKHV